MIETIYSDSDFLEHHGVKGMKWGVRKQQPPSSRRTKGQSLKNLKRGYVSGHYLRNKRNKNLPKNEKDAEAQGWRKLSKKDSSMHQFHKNDGVRNSKWVSPDGHREVVFTGKGENQRITTRAEDEGTYNFFDPKAHPIGHAVFDVAPYVFLGNGPKDSTTLITRLEKSYKNFMEVDIDIDDLIPSIDLGEDFINDLFKDYDDRRNT